MSQKNKIISRFLIDISGAVVGLVIGLLWLQVFRNGVALPLDNTDWFVLLSSIFTCLFLSSISHKFISRLISPIKN